MCELIATRFLSTIILVALSAACGSNSETSCSIPSGNYQFESSTLSDAGCQSSFLLGQWPPLVADQGQPVPETCTTSSSNGQCQAVCTPEGVPLNQAPTVSASYSRTSSGFAGTMTFSGTPTCAYTFSATSL
jgi:hypothetical protein